MKLLSYLMVKNPNVYVVFLICLFLLCTNTFVYGQNWWGDLEKNAQKDNDKDYIHLLNRLYETRRNKTACSKYAIDVYLYNNEYKFTIYYDANEQQELNSDYKILSKDPMCTYKQKEIPNSNDCSGNNSVTGNDTYTPPPPKYTYNGVEYPTKAAMNAAIKDAETKNFQTNVKPQIDAGFRDISSTNKTSGYKSVNSTSTSSGFREIGKRNQNESPRPQVQPLIETTTTSKEKPQVLSQSKGTYYGVLQDLLAKPKGLNVAKYFSEAEWNDCAQNSKNFFTPECKDFQRKYSQFLHDCYGADNLLEMDDEQKKELIDMGIDVADIYLSTGTGVAASFFGTPVAGAVASGSIEATSSFLKGINHGESPKDIKIWKDALLSGLGAGASGAVKFKVVEGAGKFVNLKSFVSVVTTKGVIAGTTERLKGKSPEEARSKAVKVTVLSAGTTALGTVVKFEDNRLNQDQLLTEEVSLNPILGGISNAADKVVTAGSKNKDENKTKK